MSDPGTFEEWLKTRPASVQALAKEFPMGTRTEDPDGICLYLLGYTEDDKLIMSPVDPTENYDGAMAHRVHLCASHLRKS